MSEAAKAMTVELTFDRQGRPSGNENNKKNIKGGIPLKHDYRIFILEKLFLYRL